MLSSSCGRTDGASDRFFLATVMGGRLHLDGIPDWGPWEASRLHWWPEDHLDLVLTTTRERKVRTPEELEAAIQEPMNVAPTRNVWIHESLEDEARRLWGDRTVPLAPDPPSRYHPLRRFSRPNLEAVVDVVVDFSRYEVAPL